MNTRQTLLTAATALAAGLLAGCPPQQLQPGGSNALTQPAAIGPAPVVGIEPTASGIFVPIGKVDTWPLTGEPLNKAVTPRATIVDGAKTLLPAIEAAATQAATSPATQPVEPSPAAVKYYIRGREKLLDGANSEALELFNQALQIDPNAFVVLKTMGQVSFAANQLGRGALYLNRAVLLRPDDVEVNYLLGRYWLETRDYVKAIYFLNRADTSPERSVALPLAPLTSFYLAQAFQRAGYYRAAGLEFEETINLLATPMAAYRYDGFVTFLTKELGTTHLSAAENFAATGDFARALPHYQAAAAQDRNNSFILSRLVAAQARLGRHDQAATSALDMMAAARGSDESIDLLTWVYRAGGREPQLVPDLQQKLAGKDKSQAALALAGVQKRLGQKNEALRTLGIYIAQNPADLVVLNRMFSQVDSETTFGLALDAVATALRAQPDKHDELVRILLDSSDSTPARQFAAASPAINNREPIAAQRHYLIALLQRRADRSEKTIESHLQSAIDLDPSLWPAREALVTQLLSTEQFKRADALIEAAIKNRQGPGNGSKAYAMLIESEIAQQRYKHALQLAQEAVQNFPDSPDMKLFVAGIHRFRDEDQAADDALQAVIDAFPKNEIAYRRLIDSQLQQARQRDGDTDPDRYVQRALATHQKLMREIPDSRFGQMFQSRRLAEAGRGDEAELILRNVLKQSPDDPEAISMLAVQLFQQGRVRDAVKLLEDSVKAKPQPAVAELLTEVYRETRRGDMALALTERLMKENAAEVWLLLHTSELLSQQRRSQADKLLREGMTKFPKHQGITQSLVRLLMADKKFDEAISTFEDFIKRNGPTAERYYFLSHIYNEAGREEQTNNVLLKVLEIMPDHTGASNDLGYFWTDAGINLDKAEVMIRRAVENHPNNSAFADSLGWIYYKKGNFDEALKLLERSVSLPGGNDPEVLAHLGDTLYRLGRKDDALDRYIAAQAQLRDDAPRAKSRLTSHIDNAIEALRNGRPVVTAPIAGEKPASTASTKPGA